MWTTFFGQRIVFLKEQQKCATFKLLIIFVSNISAITRWKYLIRFQLTPNFCYIAECIVRHCLSLDLSLCNVLQTAQNDDNFRTLNIWCMHPPTKACQTQRSIIRLIGRLQQQQQHHLQSNSTRRWIWSQLATEADDERALTAEPWQAMNVHTERCHRSNAFKCST